jgi:hypothetical protein
MFTVEKPRVYGDHWRQELYEQGFRKDFKYMLRKKTEEIRVEEKRKGVIGGSRSGLAILQAFLEGDDVQPAGPREEDDFPSNGLRGPN